ncbi:MAG: NADH-quinone oxidoreductase subunit L [Proteobacteria bacterium]|nr:MAG: NADH-quinone oxidoreductase subunit L [Pseudomonadota bacterium]
MIELAYIILSPVIGAIFLGLLYLFSVRGLHVKKIIFTAIGLISPFISFVFGIKVFLKLLEQKNPITFTAYEWLNVGNFHIKMEFLADNLSIFMVLFVSFVAWLIHIYASGYMDDDEGYGKFFFYFNLFLASMLLLVLGSSPIIMFIGWEGVGVCSYFLISYYYKDNENVVAGNKAFLVNRIGDAGFIVGMCSLFFYAGQSGFDFQTLSANVGLIPHHIKIFIGLSLFIGAMAKSAQIPLYVWLPDAMAGPTPVSALIHAATMVTAGVYMVRKFAFLYNDIPSVGLFIAYIGAFSSVLAALIAIGQRDIKKILAYSTMSQLGYMFVAVGLANYSGGLFHVFTHAFFKALLFMGAGAVIVALHHEQDIFKMGGLKKDIPVIWLVMLVGCLAISGIPPFSGFFSKDEILFTAFANGEYLLWGLEVFTAFLTSYYMFRLFFVVFYAKNSDRAGVHDIPKIMIYPLIILALGATIVGFLGVPHVFGVENYIHSFLGASNKQIQPISHVVEFSLMGLNILVGIFGINLAWKRYGNWNFSKKDKKPALIENKFYVDEIYHVVFVRSIQKLSNFVANFLDLQVIDGAIMRVSEGFLRVGKRVSILQNANIRAYVFAMLVGFGMMSLYLLSVLD